MTDPLRLLFLLARYGRDPKFCERLRRIITVEWLWPYIYTSQSILEIGAGDGQTICFLARRFPKKTFLACEPDPKQTGRLADLANRRRLTNIAINSAPFDEYRNTDGFDLIYAVDVLEHIPDDAALVMKVREQLRLGGQLFLHVPVPGIPQFDDPGHARAGYEMDDLRNLLEEAGFKIERIEYTFGWRGLHYHHSETKMSRLRRMFIHLLDVADNRKVRSEIGVIAIRS